MAGETESWLRKQNHGWGNRVMAGEKSGNPGFPGLPSMDYSGLRADERLGVHPIRVTTHLAERADLEVIDSSHGQASDDGLPGTGNRSYRPGTEYTTCTF